MIQLSDTQFLFTSPIPSNEPLLSQPHSINSQTFDYDYHQHTFINPTVPGAHTTPEPYTTNLIPKQLTTYILTLN